MIYHITTQVDWERALTEGIYRPEGFEKENFIHCSKARQLAAVGNRYYQGQSGLVVLCIDTNRLHASVIYENTVGGTERFPHIYGLLNLDAVARVVAFPPGTDGSFALPKEIE
jgi:uncharacterized protein (DUF952 family)